MFVEVKRSIEISADSDGYMLFINTDVLLEYTFTRMCASFKQVNMRPRD